MLNGFGPVFCIVRTSLSKKKTFFTFLVGANSSFGFLVKNACNHEEHYVKPCVSSSTGGFERSTCPPCGRVHVDRANRSCGFKQITKNTRDWGWKASSVWIRNRISTDIDSEHAKLITAVPHLRLGWTTRLLGPTDWNKKYGQIF